MRLLIKEKLLSMQDEKYAAFQRRLIPNIDPETIIGVRTPLLRSLAKELSGTAEGETFLQDLPHRTFEENQLHSFLLCREKNFARCVEQIEVFLPYVDNWATCDQLSPTVFGKHLSELYEKIKQWLRSEEPYTVRFGIEMLMRWFLDEAFQEEQSALVAAVQSDEYYVKMMVAWYFATALAKQYDAVICFIEQNKLEPWTHNMTIRKAIESYRITPEQKAYLRTFKTSEKKTAK